MSRTIDDLRRHLFAALEGLADKQNPMDIERAKAVSEVAQTIINSAKVELDHLKVTGAKGTGFLPAHVEPEPKEKETATGTVTRLPGVTQHKLR